jgi:OmcA/MtrC family decaheme c-type cytochrome
MLAGPAGTDYVIPATGSANVSCGTNGASVVVVNAANGEYSLPIGNGSLPDGTYTLTYEMMYSRQAGDDATGIVRKPFAAKPNFYTATKSGATWTFGAANPRRAVVSFDKCNNCHIQIGFHSNQGRQGPDYCATCHNPKLENGTRDRVKFADARDYTDYIGYTTTTSGKVYLTESVSANVFIHRIHMGSELPSVQNATQASPWVPEPGRIFYGATRSAFVGVTATTPPEITDLSEFAMPNPIGRCDQCHLSGTWAAPLSSERAPVERSFRDCNPVTPSWASGEQWCDNTSNSGPTKRGILVTPPVKAVCTSCHDDLATDTHADQNTTSPMSASAVERCDDCHGAGTTWDSMKVHAPIP